MMALAVDDVALLLLLLPPALVALPIPVPTPKAELRQTHTCPEVAWLGFGAGQDLLLIICHAYCAG